VDCRFVILVKLVKKVILAAPNAPVATLVNRVRVIMALVKRVRWVNLVHPMIKTLLHARHATPGIIKKIRAKRLVYRAFLERMKTILVRTLVKIATLVNIKMHLAMKRVWIVVLDNT
jgi:hypothetical protein